MIESIISKVPRGKDELLERDKHYFVSYINPYNYAVLKDRKDLVQQLDYCTFDGILLSVLFRIFQLKDNIRLSPDFSSYFLDLFTQAAKEKDRIYLVGTEIEKLECAVANFRMKFPGIVISGYHSGFFSNVQRDNIIEEIKEKADIVLVGMGAGKQEEFLVELKNKNWYGRAYACGGFLHQSAEKAVYYPEWISKLHLRWVYRMLDEPKLFRRYFWEYPLALLIILKDIYSYKRERR